MSYDKHRRLQQIVEGKKVLFVTTKNIDYIRNAQEIRILKTYTDRLELLYSNKKNYIKRVLEIWRKFNKKNIEKNDVIFVGFAPQLVIPFKWYLLKNKVVVIDFFISVYDTLVCDRKKIKLKSFGAKFCHKLDEFTLNKANYVISDTNAHANFFATEFRADLQKIETIYLEADPTIYFPRLQKKEIGLQDKFVVLYFGSVLPLQGVDVILEAIRSLKNREDIFFDIIGPIPKKYDKPIQKNVRYIEWIEQKELAEHIANADLCLAGHFNENVMKAKRTIPGKAYIYEMMGKTMVLGDGAANHELFSEDEQHYFVEMGNAVALSKKICEICEKGTENGSW